MKHPSLRELYDYWNLRRGRRAAPDRADIEPSAIRRVLADTFILSFDEAAGHPFRIAGTRICAATGYELKNQAFLDLWALGSRPAMRDLINIVAHEAVGATASVRGASTSGSILEMELLVLPLSHRGRTDARILGALTPRGTAQWLGTFTVGKLNLGNLRYLGAAQQEAPPPASPHSSPPLAPSRPQGRIRHGFVVYDGGQS